jgi:hypothetical protein
MSTSDLHWTDLVRQAVDVEAGHFLDFGDDLYAEDNRQSATLAACEVFYGHGFSDDSLGSVEDFGHYYRVSRWTVATDSRGFTDLTEHGSEAEAVQWWKTLEAEYDDFWTEADHATTEL